MKGALLHSWLSLLFSGYNGTNFKRKSWRLSIQIKIWQLILVNHTRNMKVSLCYNFLMEFLSVEDVWGSTLWEQVKPHTIHFWYRYTLYWYRLYLPTQPSDQSKILQLTCPDVIRLSWKVSDQCMHKTSFIIKVLVNSALLHRWLNSLASDFDSTYFESKNNAFLVKWKFGNSYFLTQGIRNKKLIWSSNS